MPISRTNKRCRRQAGYTLLMVVFMVATILILMSAAVPNILTQGRREREEEMIWRGQQYARAIGMYYAKFGKYPTKIDDLTNQTNGVRFLRKAYTDPMNKDDGSWRFIYVGPSGQLIGSLRQTSVLLPGASASGTAGAGAQPGSATPTDPNAAAAQAAAAASGAGPSSGSGANPGNTSSPGGAAAGQSGQQNGLQTGNGLAPITLAPDSLTNQAQPLGGTVLGGNIIGVGSKVKAKSLRVYLGGDTYEQWEFIWNPMLATTAGQQPAGQQAPANAPGAATTGTQPGSNSGAGTFQIPGFSNSSPSSAPQ